MFRFKESSCLHIEVEWPKGVSLLLHRTGYTTIVFRIKTKNKKQKTNTRHDLL